MKIIHPILFLLIYQFFFSEHILHFFKTSSLNLYGYITIYLLIFSLVYYLFSFPLNFYGSYILEHKFSLSNQSLTDWIKDEFKKNFISLVLFLLLVQGFYLLLRKTGDFWWVWVSLAWISFNVIFAKILPNFIIPIFYKYSPLKNENLKNRGSRKKIQYSPGIYKSYL